MHLLELWPLIGKASDQYFENNNSELMIPTEDTPRRKELLAERKNAEASLLAALIDDTVNEKRQKRKRNSDLVVDLRPQKRTRIEVAVKMSLIFYSNTL